MLEKTGMLALTKQELQEVKHGDISDRLQEAWSLSTEELEGMIKRGSYTLIDDDNNETTQVNKENE